MDYYYIKVKWGKCSNKNVINLLKNVKKRAGSERLEPTRFNSPYFSILLGLLSLSGCLKFRLESLEGSAFSDTESLAGCRSEIGTL